MSPQHSQPAEATPTQGTLSTYIVGFDILSPVNDAAPLASGSHTVTAASEQEALQAVVDRVHATHPAVVPELDAYVEVEVVTVTPATAAAHGLAAAS